MTGDHADERGSDRHGRSSVPSSTGDLTSSTGGSPPPTGDQEATRAPMPHPSPVADEVLPSQTSDDLDATWGERPAEDDDDRFLRERPPHW